MIGRTVENAFVGYVCQILMDHAVERVTGEYHPTRRNSVVAGLYRDLGFRLVGEQDGVTRWSLALRERRVAIPDWITIEDREETLRA